MTVLDLNAIGWLLDADVVYVLDTCLDLHKVNKRI